MGARDHVSRPNTGPLPRPAGGVTLPKPTPTWDRPRLQLMLRFVTPWRSVTSLTTFTLGWVGRFIVPIVAAGVIGCPKKPPPPPPAPPPLCALVERNSDRIVEEVRCALTDGDEDGVDDAVDHCLGLLEVRNGLSDLDGCPDPDQDEDGFADFEDACPSASGESPDGCPLVDRDQDLIADHLDACPTQPEDLDGDQDADGCPDGRPSPVVRMQSSHLWQTGRVLWQPGRAQLSPAGKELLDRLVDVVLTRVNDVERVRIVGYASVRETVRGRAKTLAARRLEIVQAAFLEIGLSREQIEAAVFPLRAPTERSGRVDVSVFLPLVKALAPAAVATAPAGAALPVGEVPGKPAAEWDEPVLPYPEPTQAPAPEDWDL